MNRAQRRAAGRRVAVPGEETAGPFTLADWSHDDERDWWYPPGKVDVADEATWLPGDMVGQILAAKKAARMPEPSNVCTTLGARRDS